MDQIPVSCGRAAAGGEDDAGAVRARPGDRPRIGDRAGGATNVDAAIGLDQGTFTRIGNVAARSEEDAVVVALLLAEGAGAARPDDRPGIGNCADTDGAPVGDVDATSAFGPDQTRIADATYIEDDASAKFAIVPTIVPEFDTALDLTKTP